MAGHDAETGGHVGPKYAVDDARLWLRQAVRRPSPKTMLCIDSPDTNNSVLRSELDELLVATPGQRLRLVIAIDENAVGAFTEAPTGREHTRLGRRSSILKLAKFDASEFAAAKAILGRLGGGLVFGAEFASELRAPWILRAVAASAMHDLPEDKVVVLAPVLGASLFEVADERFDGLGELRQDLQKLARIYVDELLTQRHVEDVLASQFVFSVSQDAARKGVDRHDLRAMVAAGLLRLIQAASDVPVYAIRVPELFGHEVATRISTLLRSHRADPTMAAKWLARICARMPLGDAICAYAINRKLQDLGGRFLLELINGLLQLPPRSERMESGSQMVTLIPSIGLIDFTVTTDGRLVLRPRKSGSQPLTLDVGEDDLRTVASLDAWLILSRLDLSRVLYRNEDGTEENIASGLLMELGACPVVLRKLGEQLEEFHTHSIDGGEISCLKNGIAEPITWAIAELLSRDIPGVDRDGWVRTAVATDSFPLINRLSQALWHLEKLEGCREWAQQMQGQVVSPALRGHPQFH